MKREKSIRGKREKRDKTQSQNMASSVVMWLARHCMDSTATAGTGPASAGRSHLAGTAIMVVDHTNKYLFDSSHQWMYALGRICMPLFVFVISYNM